MFTNLNLTNGLIFLKIKLLKIYNVSMSWFKGGEAMPTYEYYCEKCGVFEEFHSMNTALTQCPKCQGKVRRMISRNTNIIFKGSGFYVTDNRSSSYQKGANGDGGSGSTSDAKSDNKAS
jgi:putative FmdB family regulatory protein